MSIPAVAALSFSAAAIAYINAKHGIAYDFNTAQAWITSSATVKRAVKSDTVNVFYTFEDHATNPKTANRTFLIFEGKRWTYSEAYENVLKYGTWLKQTKHVKKGDVIAMDFQNNALFIWIWLGLWSIGAKPAFINYNLVEKPLIHSVKASGARLLLVDSIVKANFTDDIVASLKNDDPEQHAEKPFEIVHFNPEIEKEILEIETKRAPNEERGGEEPHHTAMLVFTSGTTGMPKPAIVSWQKCRFGGNFLQRWIGFKGDDIMYTCMPLYHSSAAVLGFCSVIAAGSALALGRRFSRSTFWQEVHATQATLIQYVGETCRYLLSAPPSTLDKTHKVRVAYGNGLRPDVWRRFKERFRIETIAEFYAATESPLALWNLSTSNFTEGAVGYSGKFMRFLLGMKSRIIEIDIETNTPRRDPKTGFCIVAKANQPGELISRLDENNVSLGFQGYYGNSKASESKVMRNVFRKGDAWFSTGDIMRKDNDDRWYFHDRVGDTFRWKSENVSTAEVSQTLGTLPGVAEANVYGVRLPHHDGRAGCAAIKFETEYPINEALLGRLAKHAATGLPKYALPLFLRITNEIQATGTNKQQKHKLREEGVDPEKVVHSGDNLYWLKDGSYRPFGETEWNELRHGRVKL